MTNSDKNTKNQQIGVKMNKSRQALNYLKSLSNQVISVALLHYISIIEELVNRDEAKQVNHLHPLKAFGKCPVCNETVHLRHHRQFCGECGKRLGWSKDD